MDGCRSRRCGRNDCSLAGPRPTRWNPESVIETRMQGDMPSLIRVRYWNILGDLNEASGRTISACAPVTQIRLGRPLCFGSGIQSRLGSFRKIQFGDSGKSIYCNSRYNCAWVRCSKIRPTVAIADCPRVHRRHKAKPDLPRMLGSMGCYQVAYCCPTRTQKLSLS